MPERRPVTRVFLVLPPEPDGSGRPQLVVDALAGLLSDDLAARGVQVARHVAGSAPEGSARADVALWLPDAAGRLLQPQPREAPARVVAGFVVDPGVDRAQLARFDALLVPHEALVEPVRAAAKKGGRHSPEVVAVRVPAAAALPREAEKAGRKLGDLPVVLVDTRHDFEADIERMIFQLALHDAPAVLVLLVPHDDRARARARSLCERHEVDAFLASGHEAFATAVPACDLVLGRPSWVELLLAAVHGTAVAWLGDEGGAPRPLMRALRAAGALGEVTGVLQLAAALDGRLLDRGGMAASGTALHEQLVGEARAFLEVLGTLHPGSLELTGAAAWEAVGPHAKERREGEPVKVEARDVGQGSGDRAARIEAALTDLKARMRDDGAS
jgi:hypothetical protein